MTIEISPEEEKVLMDLVTEGQFPSLAEAVHQAILSLTRTDVERGPLYPAGSLAHLYTPEENEKEARLASAHPVELEAF